MPLEFLTTNFAAVRIPAVSPVPGTGGLIWDATAGLRSRQRYPC